MTTGGMPRRNTPSMSPPSSAEDIARRHQLALIVQFGSTVSGTVHAGSDMDVAVLFKRYQDHRRYLALEREHVRRALANPRS
jgi:predicted nucleotidyltransferase